MNQPITQPKWSPRASRREAAPTAAQWACCTAAAGVNPFAWQVSVYQFAQQRAAESVRTDWRLRHEPNPN